MKTSKRKQASTLITPHSGNLQKIGMLELIKLINQSTHK
jgi:hypothetical protein